MTQHISIRLAWHDSGWNGHICGIIGFVRKISRLPPDIAYERGETQIEATPMLFEKL
jgi:hypothetical protein